MFPMCRSVEGKPPAAEIWNSLPNDVVSTCYTEDIYVLYLLTSCMWHSGRSNIDLQVAVCCQVVTCVPTSVLPKRCRCGSTVGQDTGAMLPDNGEADDDVIDEIGERGHILWIRGLSRLQHQVSTSSSSSSSSSLSSSSEIMNQSINQCKTLL